jgi:signal transduction histidine kinase
MFRKRILSTAQMKRDIIAWAKWRKPKEVEVTCEDQIFALVITPISGTGYVNAYGLDITYRKTVEKALLNSVETLESRVSERTIELKEAYEQRDYLSRKLVDLLERERREIGWTLHEQLAQILAGADCSSKV